MRRTKEEAAKTKESIFQAGIRLLASKGVQQTSMSDIARAAGVTRGAIYWHFSNKEDLYNEIYARLSIFYEAILSIAEDSKPLLWSLKETLQTVLRRFSEDEEFRLLQSLQIQIGMLYPGQNVLESDENMRENRIQTLFENRCLAEGVCSKTNTQTLLLALQSFVLGTFTTQILLGSRLSEDQINQYIDYFIHGLNITLKGEIDA